MGFNTLFSKCHWLSRAHGTHYNGVPVFLYNNPWFYSLILATSQPLQANPPGPSSGSGSGSPQKSSGSNKAFPIEALARREGVKLQEVYVPKNIVIPTKNQAPIGKSNF